MIGLILVRHGQTDFNQQRRFQGQRDTPLNFTGREQVTRSAQIVANVLKQSFSNTPVVSLSSDLCRASETADFLNKELKLAGIDASETEKSPLLREWHCGDLEGFTVEEFETKHPHVLKDFYASFEKNPLGTCYPGGECREMVWARVRRVFEILSLYQSKVGVLATHGGWIQSLLECMGLVNVGEGQVIGNGDVLVLAPPKMFASDFKGWALTKHYKIGTNVAAKIT
jgi:broad specificity phosphatase PhoE